MFVQHYFLKTYTELNFKQAHDLKYRALFLLSFHSFSYTASSTLLKSPLTALVYFIVESV
jgi:hypothetical protein